MTQPTDTTSDAAQATAGDPSIEDIARPLRWFGWGLGGVTVASFAAGLTLTYMAPAKTSETPEAASAAAAFNQTGGKVAAAHSVTFRAQAQAGAKGPCPRQ